jgi:hypothetical protein
MELKDRLVTGLKKEAMSELVQDALSSEALFAEMVQFAISEHRVHAPKAAWVLAHVTAIDPRMANMFLNQWRETLDKTLNSSVQREILKIIRHCKLPEEMEGWFLDKCFLILQSPNTEAAAKYHSISFILVQTKRFPELKMELVSILEEQVTWHTPAWQRYIGKIIAKLIAQKRVKR